MDVLVIGGSVFLGRAVVREAQARDAAVTVFNRGKSGPAPTGVEVVTGDRTDPADLARLAGRHFDLVVDTCGYVPAEVASSAEVLEPTCGRYAFVSTVSVYPGWPEAADYHEVGPYTGSAAATRADVPPHLDEGAAYGWLKSGCEQAVIDTLGTERTTVLRGGCIVGPDDSAVGRLPWWIARVARGGEVLVPGAPDDPMSLVDSRDLAAFALSGATGIFEATGPAGRDTRAALMAACREVTGSDARFTYVDDAWLAAHDVEPWTEVPLWHPNAPSLFRHDPTAAEAAGLRWRPLRDTVADTWTWQRGVPGGWRPAERTPGLAADRERELVAGWHSRDQRAT